MNLLGPAVILLLLFLLEDVDARLRGPRRRLLPAVAQGQELEQPQEDRILDVIVALQQDCFLPDFVDKLDFFEAKLETVLHRTNSLALQVPARNLDLLELDTCTKLVEEDIRVESLRVTNKKAMTTMITTQEETIPWGVPLVLPNPQDIPPPPDDAECFKICIIDSGLMVNHEDILFSKNGTNIEGNEFSLPIGETWDRPAPQNTHGTHVAGIVIAKRGNNLGVAGLIGNPENNNMCLLIARVFSDSEGSNKGSAIEAGLEWCADRGAKVINMSLGGADPTENSREMYQTMRDEGRLVVASAGNGRGRQFVFPASFPNVVSVGAIDENLRRASFSQYNEQVDLCAPGVNVLSTVPGAFIEDDDGNKFPMLFLQHSVIPDDVSEIAAEMVDCGLGEETCKGAQGKICYLQRGEITFQDKGLACQRGGGIAAIIYNNVDGDFYGTLAENNGVSIPVVGITRASGQELESKVDSTVSIKFEEGTYARLSGTSMAAPYVSAAAALIWAARPQCTPDQVEKALEETAVDLGLFGKDDEYGHGLVQANDAYVYLLGLEPPCGIGTGGDEEIAWSADISPRIDIP